MHNNLLLQVLLLRELKDISDELRTNAAEDTSETIV